MDNFSKNASKFFENGITIESINNFIISGIKSLYKKSLKSFSSEKKSALILEKNLRDLKSGRKIFS